MASRLSSSTHTSLTPPMMDDDRLSWLRLYRSHGVGVQSFFRLIREHGDAATVLERLPDLAAKAGVRGYDPQPMDATLAEVTAAKRVGARLVLWGDAAYPDLLAEIDDAPPVLWAKGRMDLLMQPKMAIVGARNASSLGERIARSFARDLGAAGIVTVSGMARGIDANVHEASLETGTIAVLGGGVDVTYPAENAKLYERIAASGLLVSEQPMGMAPQARHFPRRNRIISGLSQGLVVVEAASRSGSLSTARCAADQGREVMAVPGHPFDGRAGGCNLLIRDGATLVRSAEDVREALTPTLAPDRLPQARATAEPGSDRAKRPAQKPIPAPVATGAGDRQAAILARLGPSPMTEDQLIRDLRWPAQVVAPVLTDLELDGRIARHPGGMVSLA